MTYIWNHDAPLIRSKSGKIYQKGEEFTPTDSEMSAFRGMIEQVEDETDAETHREDDDESSLEFDPDTWLDFHYKERIDHIQDGKVDDHLEKIKEIETSQQVKEAIAEY